MPYKDHTRQIANQRAHYRHNRERILAYEREYYQQHIEKVKARRRELSRTPSFRKRRREYERHYHEKLRLKVFIAYAGNPPKCACCGEPTLEFLAIDHINGGGRKQRLEHGAFGVYRWLVRNGFPPGFRVLCYNCNLARGFYGYCPHENGGIKDGSSTG